MADTVFLASYVSKRWYCNVWRSCSMKWRWICYSRNPTCCNNVIGAWLNQKKTADFVETCGWTIRTCAASRGRRGDNTEKKRRKELRVRRKRIGKRREWEKVKKGNPLPHFCFNASATASYAWDSVGDIGRTWLDALRGTADEREPPDINPLPVHLL